MMENLDARVLLQNAFARSPAVPDVLISASADESVQLWNMATGDRLATLHGDAGHLAEVVDVAWHPAYPWLVASAGLDDAIVVWSLVEVGCPALCPNAHMFRMCYIIPESIK
jgi:WD40 repeat protein